MEVFKIVLLVFTMAGFLSTIFFVTWYTIDTSQLNKKIKYYLLKGKYPTDSQSISYWDFIGWTEDSYSSIPKQKVQPELYKIELFIEELNTNKKIFRLSKLSAITAFASMMISGFILDKVI